LNELGIRTTNVTKPKQGIKWKKVRKKIQQNWKKNTHLKGVWLSSSFTNHEVTTLGVQRKLRPTLDEGPGSNFVRTNSWVFDPLYFLNSDLFLTISSAPNTLIGGVQVLFGHQKQQNPPVGSGMHWLKWFAHGLFYPSHY
jgi:hypothetical protein